MPNASLAKVISMGVATALASFLPGQARAAEAAAVPLFDGKTFTGWEGNLEAFRIEDGAVVGGSLTRPVARNEYFCTREVYGDFELRLQFKVLGPDPNAGIQFRSERVPGSSEMVGYQADIGQVYWGCLYDERRHKLLTGPTPAEQQTLLRKEDWNDYVIRCQGPRIRLWLNSRQTVDYTEPDPNIPLRGVIGLQIHAGPPSESWYKNITLELLPPAAARPGPGMTNLLAGRFQWRMSQPLVSPASSPEDTYHSVKDPSVVFHGGRWHLFCTVRGKNRSHQIEYVSFADWGQTEQAQRQMLRIHDGFFCAPQVFFFVPHQKWYLICQASDQSWDPQYGAACATTTDIANPASWSKLTPLKHHLADGKSGLDFWVICDDTNAHLFFTTLDGRMWREQTTLTNFPRGWSEPVLAIQDDIFEASHTYKVQGLGKYLTVVEAQNGPGWRYYKAYLADRLDGAWTPLAATRTKSLASLANTQPLDQRWTDCISHGELLRAGADQQLEVDPANLRFLFQGVPDSQRQGKPYGEIPWRLGLLEPTEH